MSKSRVDNLERQLAQQKRGADLPPVGPDRAQPASASKSDSTPHRFVVSAMPNIRKIIATFGLLFLGSFAFQKIWNSSSGGPVGHLGMLLGIVVAWSLAVRWLFMKKVVIRATAEGLTISRRPGDVFSLRDAELGQWRRTRGRGRYVGRALFLTSGPHRFVIGDMRNPRGDISTPRIASEVPIEGPQVEHRHLDAWTTSSAFDELLAIVGSARGG